MIIPYSFNQYIKLPITIGTIPLRYGGELPPTYEDAQNGKNWNSDILRLNIFFAVLLKSVLVII